MEVSKVHFDEHTRLPTVLSMAITDCEEVLMESLADIRSKDEVILILLVDIVHGEALTSRICKSGNHVILDYFNSFLAFLFLYLVRR